MRPYVRVKCSRIHNFIDLAGELTFSAETALLNAYQQASSNGARLVILNFRQLEYKNSSAITLLVALLARCNSAVQHIYLLWN